MITDISQKISHYLVQNGADGNNEAVLSYGAECFINLLISDGFLLLVGVLTNRLVYLLIWAISYSLLRINLGGLHAPSHFWCIVIGTAIGASSILVSRIWLINTYITTVCVATAALIAIIIAPVAHKHKQHIQKQRRRIKQRVAVILLCECLAIIIYFQINPTIASYIVSGLIMATVLAVLGALFNPR
jgi:accessory gene regulator B